MLSGYTGDAELEWANYVMFFNRIQLCINVVDEFVLIVFNTGARIVTHAPSLY